MSERREMVRAVGEQGNEVLIDIGEIATIEQPVCSDCPNQRCFVSLKNGREMFLRTPYGELLGYLLKLAEAK